MVQSKQQLYSKSVPAPRGLPGMKPELVRVHHAIHAVGATSGASARALSELSRRTGIGKNALDDALHTLEGKGVATHITSGHETLWYVSR